MARYVDIIGQQVSELEGITDAIQQLISEGRLKVMSDGGTLLEVKSISHSVTPAGDGRRFIVTVVQFMQIG